MKKIFIIISYLLIVTAGYAQSYKLSRAKWLIETEEYLEAAKVLRPLAEEGDAEAQFISAGLFLEGKGVIKSEKQAEKYYSLAAEADYEPAIIALVDYYEQAGKHVEAARLLTKKYEKETLPNSLYSKYGQYLYNGKGNVKVDKLKGWVLIFQNEGEIDEQTKKDFYESIINEGKQAPEHMFSLFCNELWSNKNTKIEWTINYLDDVMQFIKASDSIQQAKFVTTLESMYNTHDQRPTALFLSMMYAEGVGTPMNADKAQQTYTNAVDDNLYSLLYNNLLKNNENGSDGHLRKSDFPRFFNVILKDYRERAERWDYQEKLKKLELSGANVFKVKSFNVHYNNGRISFVFELFNTSPNPTGRGTIADNVFIKYNGEYYDAKIWFQKDENIGIKGHATTRFSITFDEIMPPSGVLDCVQFTLSCDFGKGYISARNVVWNEKFQE